MWAGSAWLSCSGVMCLRARVRVEKEKKRKNYIGSETTPHIN